MKPGLIPLDVVRNRTDLYASTFFSPINQPIKHIHLRQNGTNALDGSNPGGGRSLIVRRASEITPEPIEWLWPNRVAIGKQTMIDRIHGVSHNNRWTLAMQRRSGSAWQRYHSECGR
jgi:hypothetical protein